MKLQAQHRYSEESLENLRNFAPNEGPFSDFEESISKDMEKIRNSYLTIKKMNFQKIWKFCKFNFLIVKYLFLIFSLIKERKSEIVSQTIFKIKLADFYQSIPQSLKIGLHWEQNFEKILRFRSLKNGFLSSLRIVQRGIHFTFEFNLGDRRIDSKIE